MKRQHVKLFSTLSTRVHSVSVVDANQIIHFVFLHKRIFMLTLIHMQTSENIWNATLANLSVIIVQSNMNKQDEKG